MGNPAYTDLCADPGRAASGYPTDGCSHREPVRGNNLELRVCPVCSRWRALDWFKEEDGPCWKCRALGRKVA